ncbi:MAG: SMC family ATPase [Candidatus Omnitrophica bacterium]|nr:SMC family ATPase [Candidatus Omnitrophota bacterium]
MISKVRLKNWKTHLDSEFVFDKGVNTLVGVMGSGKTSVLDAICFALFGTFPAAQQRRMKLGNVVMNYPHKKTEACVELELMAGDKKYTIARRVKKHKGTSFSEIKENGKVIEGPNPVMVTEMAEKILKIDYALFSQIIYSEQNRIDQFLLIPRGQRMKKIDDLLKIDKFGDARAGAVALINKLRDKGKTRTLDYERIKENLKEMDIKGLRVEIEKLKLNENAIAGELQSIKETQAVTAKYVDELREKKALFDALERKEISLSSKLEQINKELSKPKRDISHYTVELVEKEIQGHNGVLTEQRTIEKELIQLKEKESSTRERIKEINLETERMDKNREKLKKLSEVEIQVKKYENEHEKIREEIAGINARIETEKKALAELQKSGANCPVCESDLPLAKKKNLMKLKEGKLKKLENSISSGREKSDDIKNKLSGLKRDYEDYARYRNADEDIKALNEKNDKIKNLLEGAEKELRNLQSKFSRDKMDGSERKIKELEEIMRILGHAAEKKELEREIKAVEERIKKTDFKEELLDEKQKQKNELDKGYVLMNERLNSLHLLMKEKREWLSNFERQRSALAEMKSEIDELEDISEELNKFKVVLEETQVALREQFLDSVNYMMSDLWDSFYPYEDYIDIQLAIDGDYVLQLANSDGVWVNVEGVVSGGERTSAALVLRLALALVLAPNIKWLILDEPTHNLDRKAVEELGETLRAKVSGLVEQVFIITHDETLENAVTGKSYRLERGSGKKDVTRVAET